MILSVRKRSAPMSTTPTPMRQPLARVNYTKRQLNEMLAEAVRNMG
jgi:hypothetical protein